MWPKSRYTRHLEAEVERLRAENRALLNSLLARSGFPPIEGQAADPATGSVAVQPRKRSWHQWAIARTLAALKSRPLGGIVPLASRIPNHRDGTAQAGQGRPGGPEASGRQQAKPNGK